MKINNFIILTTLLTCIHLSGTPEYLIDSYFVSQKIDEIEKQHTEIYNANKDLINVTLKLLEVQRNYNNIYIENFKNDEIKYKKYKDKNELLYNIDKKILNNKLLFLDSNYKIFDLSSDLEKFRIFKEKKHMFDNEYNQKLIKEEKPSLNEKFLKEIKNDENKPKIF